jgi:starch phosphorylase
LNDPKAPSDWFKVDGVDALVELALNLHWSWNHAADELWKALDGDLWGSTQNPWVILRTVSREKIEAALGAPDFRQELDSLLQQNRDLFVSQGTLTGESLPVEKFHDADAHAANSPVELKTHASWAMTL